MDLTTRRAQFPILDRFLYFNCDGYVGGCLEWLSGGPGTAFPYCRPASPTPA